MVRKLIAIATILALPGCANNISGWHSHASSDIIPASVLEPLVVRGPTLRCAAAAQGTVVQGQYNPYSRQPANYVGISARCK